uniref:hypothetical protein n=1 Tax=Streptosporangium sp. CA-235898 TaxID=3240073 RepID=UPI003F493307
MTTQHAPTRRPFTRSEVSGRASRLLATQGETRRTGRLSLTRVRALHQETHTVADIARHLKTTPERISTLLAITDDNLTQLYTSGQTVVEISDHLNVAPTSVYQALRNANVAFRPSSRRNTLQQETNDRVVALYLSGKSIRVTAQQVGISRSAVHEILKDRQVPRRAVTRYTLITPEEKTAILAAHAAGHTTPEIANMTSRSSGGVSYVLRTHGRTPNRPMTSAEANIADVVRLYQEGAPLAQLSVQYNTCNAKITELLKSQGVKTRRRGRRPGKAAPLPLTEERCQEILSAYQAGEKINSIVARLGTSHTTILRISDAAGISRRRPGRRASGR